MICVHALKGNAKGIGADELSAAAKELEFAGKENRIDYILAHHEEMMQQHDALLDALTDNAYVYPNKKTPHGAAENGTQADEAGGTQVMTENGAQTNEATAAGSAQESPPALLGQISEKLSEFESEGLSPLLDKLALCHTESGSLKEMAEEIRALTADFDFLSASELLERMEQ